MLLFFFLVEFVFVMSSIKFSSITTTTAVDVSDIGRLVLNGKQLVFRYFRYSVNKQTILKQQLAVSGFFLQPNAENKSDFEQLSLVLRVCFSPQHACHML